MELIKTYFEYVKNPTQALQHLLHTPSFKQACWGYFVAALSWVLFFNIGDGLIVPELLIKLLILFVTALTLGTFISSLSSLFLTFRGKNLSAAQLFVLLGSSGFVHALLIAFALISATVPQAELWMLAPAAMLLVFALQVTYLTLALRRVSQTSVSLALLAWFFGLVPIAVLFALPAVFLVWIIALV